MTRRSAIFAALLAGAACRSKPAPSSPTPDAPSARPVDRLAPGELAAGSAEAWGFPIPRDMQIELRDRDAVRVVGNVKPDALANYVRDHVVVAHVEIGAARTIFPNAHIKGGPANRLFQFEVTPEVGFARLVIRDITPPPIEPGLSDADRWRKAGLSPKGEPLDIQKFE